MLGEYDELFYNAGATAIDKKAIKETLGIKQEMAETN